MLPSPAAERLFGRIQQRIGLLDDALNQMGGSTSTDEPSLVTTQVPPIAAMALAPDAVLRFQAAYPRAIGRVVEGTNPELLMQLRQSALDFVVAVWPRHP
ncbi:MAG: hypothetical protein ACRYGA_00220 [Janthinobacterium lividum]